MSTQLFPDSRLLMVKAYVNPLDFLFIVRDEYEQRITELIEENQRLNSMITNMSQTENNLHMRLIETEISLEEVKEWGKRAHRILNTLVDMGVLVNDSSLLDDAPDSVKSAEAA